MDIYERSDASGEVRLGKHLEKIFLSVSGDKIAQASPRVESSDSAELILASATQHCPVHVSVDDDPYNDLNLQKKCGPQQLTVTNIMTIVDHQDIMLNFDPSKQPVMTRVYRTKEGQLITVQPYTTIKMAPFEGAIITFIRKLEPSQGVYLASQVDKHAIWAAGSLQLNKLALPGVIKEAFDQASLACSLEVGVGTEGYQNYLKNRSLYPAILDLRDAANCKISNSTTLAGD
jgi:hypothetical protein